MITGIDYFHLHGKAGCLAEVQSNRSLQKAQWPVLSKKEHTLAGALFPSFLNYPQPAKKQPIILLQILSR
jgi:hypothetical protein